jgi:hypothetical protein
MVLLQLPFHREGRLNDEFNPAAPWMRAVCNDGSVRAFVVLLANHSSPLHVPRRNDVNGRQMPIILMVLVVRPHLQQLTATSHSCTMSALSPNALKLRSSYVYVCIYVYIYIYIHSTSVLAPNDSALTASSVCLFNSRYRTVCQFLVYNMSANNNAHNKNYSTSKKQTI